MRMNRSTCCLLAAAISANAPWPAGAVDRGAAAPVLDTRPASRFTPVATPDLRGRSGVVARLAIGADPGAGSMRARLEATASGASPWTAVVWSEDRRMIYDLIDVAGAADEIWTGEIPAARAVVEVIAPEPVSGSLVVRITALVERMPSGPLAGSADGEAAGAPVGAARDRVRASAVAWVGTVRNEGEAVCTGFLVGVDLLVTSTRCVPDARAARSAVVAFGFERADARPLAYRARRLEAADGARGWALVRVAGRPGLRWGHLDLDPRPPDTSDPLVALDHAGGGPLRVAPRCMDAGAPGCTATPGAVGAPIVDVARGTAVAVRAAPGAEAGPLSEIPAASILERLRADGHDLLADELEGRTPWAARARGPGLGAELAMARELPIEEEPDYGPERRLPGRALHREDAVPLGLPGALQPRFYVQEENDVFGLTNPSDRYYTQGLRLGFRWAPDPRHRAVDEEGTSELWGFEVGQNIYTPSDIRISDVAVLRHDRPYAGYLYAGVTFELWRPHSPVPAWARLRAGSGEDDAAYGSNLFVEVRIGATGPQALGGYVQTTWHHFLRALDGTPTPVAPAGWGLYETANATTLDATLEYAADWIRATAPAGELSTWTGSLAMLRVLPRVRLDVGGILDAAAVGLEGRIGLARDDVEPRAAQWPFELYAFGRVDGRYVAYDRLAEGPLLGGVVPEVRLRREGLDATAGVTLRVRALEVAYAQAWRTVEITPAPGGARRPHNFGSFQVSVLY